MTDILHPPRRLPRARVAACVAASFGIAASLGIAGPARAADAATELGLELETRQGASPHEPNYALDEWRLQLDGAWRGERGLSARASVSALSSARLDASTFRDTEVDALHATWSGDACRLRAGAQTIVWGQADRLRVVDVVNPVDLRESWFGDWERKRLSLGMLNAECATGAHALQLLVIPQTRFDRNPSAQGRFAVPRPQDVAAAAGIPVVDGVAPSASDPSDWSGGARWSLRLGPADLALHHYYGWEPNRRVTADAQGGLAAEADRFSMTGASFAVPVGAVVLRGELASQRDVSVATVDASGLPGAVQADLWSGLLGVDYQRASWTFSAQYFARDGDTPPDALVPVRQRVATGAIRRALFQDRVTVGAYVAVDLLESASYVSLDMQYEWTRHLLLRVVGEAFSGDASSFGRFDEQDRVVVQIRYRF